MFSSKDKLDEFPVGFVVGDESYKVISAEHYDYLNEKANKIYQVVHGYRSQEGFDYYCSSHPQESNCFMAALVLDDWCSQHDFNND